MPRVHDTTPGGVLVIGSVRSREALGHALARLRPPPVAVDGAEDVEPALAALEQGRYDAALLHLELGLHAALSILRRAGDRGLLTPILVVTPDRDDTHDHLLASAGAAATLDSHDLLPRILERALVYAIHAGRRISDLHELAHRDELTGLYNRRALVNRLGRVDRGPSGRLVGLLFIDVDGFKAVNDRMGHATGDLLLRTLAGRLRNVVRHDATIARLGGDEFAILLEEIETPATAELVAKRVVESFERPVVLGNERVALAASVGVAIGRTGEDSLDVLLTEADGAMYAAKGRAGGQYVVSRSPTMFRH